MNKLPQPNGPLYLADGGLETTLIFLDGIELPAFSAIEMVSSEEKKLHLSAYFKPYFELAAKHGTGFVLESPTWRSSHGWAEEIGRTEAELEQLSREAVQLMHQLRKDNQSNVQNVIVSGCIGPRGDGYVVDQKMTADEAQAYHGKQISLFVDEAVDCVSALTMTYAEEAIGIARAAKALGVPSIISFTVETDGCLVTGQTLEAVIKEVDEQTGGAPAYYMINCAHPSHFVDKLVGQGDWLNRIGGIRANASRCSHEELDNAEELDIGNPVELAEEYAALLDCLPNLMVLGGCCGTDLRHITAIANQISVSKAA